MANIRFENATLQYPGTQTPTIDSLNLEIQDGEFVALVGPSGSGKSTTLRMVAGLEPLAGGEIYIDDEAMSDCTPSKRDVAMVFQSYALYPHMTVEENLGFALKMQKVPAAERKTRVAEVAKMLDLENYLDRLPKALSGGQRQRVAMGRAIVRKPRVFLMDEPLSNLDAKLRVSTRAEIIRMQKRLKTTMMYVTHDQTEAMTMADRIAVLHGGVLQQIGTPDELYGKPANLFVATFIGSPAMNILPDGVVNDDGTVSVRGLRLKIHESFGVEPGQKVTVGVRPEAFKPVETLENAALTGQIVILENVGADYFVHVQPDGATENETVLVRLDRSTGAKVGDTVQLKIPTRRVHLFDPETEKRIAGV